VLEFLPAGLGRALHNIRAGLENITFNCLPSGAGTGAIKIESAAFRDHCPIPVRYTADGDGHFPPLCWTGVPAQAASVVLLVEDADSPTPHPLIHLSLIDLPPCDGSVDPDTVPLEKLGPTSFFVSRWIPPDPPPGHGAHRYAFQVFALHERSESPVDDRDKLLEVLRQSAMANGLLIGTYERSDLESIGTSAADKGSSLNAWSLA
jgi:phosphatidylethanolamine-binding protein (PEBP) family uncharacterized protein